MIKDIELKRNLMKQRFSQSERHTLQVDWVAFMEEIADIINVKPNLFKYLFTDPKLCFALTFGPSLSYQYRLEGPHPWPKAREAILTVFDRIKAPLKTKTELTKKSKSKSTNNIVDILTDKVFLSISIIVFVISIVYFY